MPKIGYLHYGSPDFLRKLKSTTLIRFLQRFDEFFCANGMPVADKFELDEEEIDRVAKIFVIPPMNTPGDLIDAIWMMDSLSGKLGYELVLSMFRKEVEFLKTEGDSAGDVVMKLWMSDRTLVEKAYSKMSLNDRRQLHCYSVGEEWPLRQWPDQDVWELIRDDLSENFTFFFNNPTVKLMPFQEDDRIAIVIRRGDLAEHMGVFDDHDNPETKLIRPVKHDIAYLYPDKGHFLCTGRCAPVRDLYRQVFSERVFMHHDALSAASRFTLDPLRHGREALHRADLGADYRAFLTELVLGNAVKSGTTTYRYEDVFAHLGDHLRVLLDQFKTVSAQFLVLVGKQKLRIAVNPSKDTIGGHKNNPLAMLWLKGCGFEK